MSENDELNTQDPQPPENNQGNNQGDNTPVITDGEKPDFLPDDCWDSENKQVKVDVLLSEYATNAKRLNGLRTKLAQGGEKAPETPDGYEFTLEDGIEIQEQDAALNAYKKVAHAVGLDNAKANALLNAFIKETGGISMDVELTPEQIEAEKALEIEKIGQNATQIIRAVNSWGKELVANGCWSEQDLQAIEGAASSAEVVIALNKLRSLTGGSDIPSTDAITDGLPSDKEIFQIIQSKKFLDGDEATLKKVENYMTLREKAGRPIYLQV